MYIPPESVEIILRQESVICYSPQVGITGAGENDYSHLGFE